MNKDSQVAEQQRGTNPIGSQASSSNGEKNVAENQSENGIEGSDRSESPEKSGVHTFTDQTNFVPVKTIITVSLKAFFDLEGKADLWCRSFLRALQSISVSQRIPSKLG